MSIRRDICGNSLEECLEKLEAYMVRLGHKLLTEPDKHEVHLMVCMLEQFEKGIKYYVKNKR